MQRSSTAGRRALVQEVRRKCVIRERCDRVLSLASLVSSIDQESISFAVMRYWKLSGARLSRRPALVSACGYMR